jgi:hypothetical protein
MHIIKIVNNVNLHDDEWNYVQILIIISISMISVWRVTRSSVRDVWTWGFSRFVFHHNHRVTQLACEIPQTGVQSRRHGHLRPGKLRHQHNQDLFPFSLSLTSCTFLSVLPLPVASTGLKVTSCGNSELLNLPSKRHIIVISNVTITLLLYTVKRFLCISQLFARPE